jgi:hypothetical protein
VIGNIVINLSIIRNWNWAKLTVPAGSKANWGDPPFMQPASITLILDRSSRNGAGGRSRVSPRRLVPRQA